MTDKRYLVIANPNSGKRGSPAAIDMIRAAIKAEGSHAEFHLTRHPNHARQIATDMCMDGYAGLGLFGGDGTFHEVVSGLMERRDDVAIPLGILPGGTGNDVVRHLGIKDVPDGINRIIAGRSIPFDVAKVKTVDQTEYCTALVGWNAVAEVNRIAERFRTIGPSRYAIAGLLQVIASRRRPAKLLLDHQSIEDEFLLVAACNTPFFGGGMRFAPRAVTDDGKLDVVVVREASRLQLLQLFFKVFGGTHVEMRNVEYYQTSSLEIAADDLLPLDIDGEVKGTTPMSVEVIPSAVRLFA